MTIRNIVHQTRSGWKLVRITSRKTMTTTNNGTTPPALFTECLNFYMIWDERKRGTGHSQQPVLYDDGRVMYDYPTMPKRFKANVAKIMQTPTNHFGR